MKPISMKFHLYARKRRQLKYIAKQIRKLLTANGGVVNSKIERLSFRLKKMLQKAKSIIGLGELKKALGAAAILFGLGVTNPAMAQTFAPPVENPFGLNPIDYIVFPSFVDLDADGDLDLFVGQYGDEYSYSPYYGNFLFFENTGSIGSPAFAAPQANPFNTSTAYADYFNIPDFTDLDNDGDQDLIVGTGGGELRYFENVGSETSPDFAPALSNPFGLDSVAQLAAPSFVDLDNDGDLDLMVGEAYEDVNDYYFGNFVFFQNIGTPEAPEFAPPIKNPFGLAPTNYFSISSFADLDDDGDLDILTGEYYGRLEYFENTGSVTGPQFAAPVINPFGIFPVPDEYVAIPACADLDNDGDVDLMISAYYGIMSFYENITNITVEVQDLIPDFNLEVFPNPVQNRLLIRTPQELEKIEIIDVLGRTVEVFNNIENSIGLEHLNAGVYTLRATDGEGHLVWKKIQKL